MNALSSFAGEFFRRCRDAGAPGREDAPLFLPGAPASQRPGVPIPCGFSLFQKAAHRLSMLLLLCAFHSPFGSADIPGKADGRTPDFLTRALHRREAAVFCPIDAWDPAVKKHMALYMGPKRRVLQAALDRMAMYRPMVRKKMQEAGLPEELAYLPLMESEYVSSAVSPAGAVGLWQFMEDTGRGYGLKVNFWLDERRDPEKATAAAALLLKDLYQWFEDWPLALAAYNRGAYGIGRDLTRARSADYAALSRRNGMPAETQEYVPNFMACVLIARDPGMYGFKVKEASLPDAEVVVLDRPLDLKIAAKCAGVDEGDIRELNPALRQWCTPAGRFFLKLPAGSRPRFLHKLIHVKDWTPSREELLALR